MSDFDAHQMVVDALKELQRDIKELGKDVTKTREDISAMKVKVGFASAFVSTIISGLFSFFVNSKR